MPSGWIRRYGKELPNGEYEAGRFDIYERDGFTCCYCEKHCLTGGFRSGNGSYLDYATLDHIVPQYELAKASESDADFRRKRRDPKNLVTVCNACNSSKRHVELYIWAASKNLDYAGILARIAERITKDVTSQV